VSARAVELGEDTAHSLVVGLSILALGWALAQWPLSWIAVLVVGGLGGLVLLLRPTWGLIPLLLTVPLARLGGLTAGGMRISPAQLVLVGVLLAWLIRMASDRHIQLPHPPLLLPLLLLLGAMAASLLGALSLGAALKELIKWGSVLAAYLFVAACVERKQVGWLVGAALIAACAQGLLGIAQFITGRGPEWFVLFGRFMRAYGTFEQPNPYGGYLGLTLPLAISVALGLRLRLGRMMACGVVVLMGAGLAMSWSRGAWVGFAAAVLVISLAHSRRTAILAGVAVGSLALVLVLSTAHLIPPILAERFAGLTAYSAVPDVTTAEVTEANYALIERLAHWQAAIAMWGDRPWLGVGAGNYAVVYPAYALPHWPEPLGHAHNYYLNIGAEAGLVGLVCYLILWISALWQAARATQRTEGLPRAVALGTLGALVHLGVHSLFDNLFVHTMYLQIAVFLGLLSVLQRDVTLPRAPGQTPGQAGKVTSFGAIAC
jgi:putative inorganic carbon (HCO3(-)) transporter